MRPRWFLLLVCLLAFASVPAQRAAPNLLAQAEAAQGKKRAELFMEVAEERVNQAGRLFEEGKIEEAQAAVKAAVAASQEASDAAIKSHRRLKQTEISVRRLARRLTEIAATLTFEDREAVKVHVEKLEAIRRELLDAMFEKKKKVAP